MTAIHLGLNQAQIEHARKRGGLTFRPVRNNRLVCNQAPELGHISSRQADSLRSQVFPKSGGQRVSKMKLHRTQGNWRNNYQTRTYGYCPNCSRNHADIYEGQRINCPCGRSLKVN